MKALIIDGTKEKNEATERIKEAAVSRDMEATVLTLREMEVRKCIGCFSCWIKSPGECALADEGRELPREWADSDIVIYVTPIFLGSYSPLLKKQLDRMIPVLLPHFKKFDGETHHPQRYKKKKALIAFGFLASGNEDEGQTFTRLVKRNALNLQAHYCDVVVSSRLEDFNPASALTLAKEALS